MKKIPVENYYKDSSCGSFIAPSINGSKLKFKLSKLRQKQKVFNKIFFRPVSLSYEIRVHLSENGKRYRWTTSEPILPFGRFIHNSHLVVNQNILRLYTKLSIKVMSWHSWKRMIGYPDNPYVLDPPIIPKRLLPLYASQYWIRLYIIY